MERTVRQKDQANDPHHLLSRPVIRVLGPPALSSLFFVCMIPPESGRCRRWLRSWLRSWLSSWLSSWLGSGFLRRFCFPSRFGSRFRSGLIGRFRFPSRCGCGLGSGLVGGGRCGYSVLDVGLVGWLVGGILGRFHSRTTTARWRWGRGWGRVGLHSMSCRRRRRS